MKKKESENLGTYVVFYRNDTMLHVSVKKDLTATDGNLINDGYFIFHNGKLDTKELFWDNLSYFIHCSKKQFKKDSKQELEEQDLDWKNCYKDMKHLIKRAKKLNLLTKK